MLTRAARAFDRRIRHWRLPRLAKEEVRLDRVGIPKAEPGIDVAVETALRWLFSAQDHSTTKDGGVARHFSLLTGWGPSYPETTGYIVPTLIDAWRRTGNSEARDRARKMLDWFVSIQFPEGGFQGGHILSEPRVPVTFNTGQILLGLAAGVAEFGDNYRDSTIRAADWLVATQDSDGCWRRHPTPFAATGEKTYETHVAWALFETTRITSDSRYAHAATANVHWALQQQMDNGWFAKCCLNDPVHPLTHTIGYALRGILEAYRFTEQRDFLRAAIKTGDSLISVVRSDGYLPGRLDAKWTPAVQWICLTGSVQIAHCLLMLFGFTNDERYLNAGVAINQCVRRTVRTEGSDGIRGGVKGAFPVDGAYGEFEYLNWACKFFIDSNVFEQTVTNGS
jgi:hypothetical protein